MNSHAINNAAAWYETITDQLSRLRAACDAGEDATYEAVQQEITESPLSVDVRSGWHPVGGNSEPVEFQILLSTGGPALRIIGELGLFYCPKGSRLQWQDWGTPWTDCTFANPADLDAWATQFWFGD